MFGLSISTMLFNCILVVNGNIIQREKSVNINYINYEANSDKLANSITSKFDIWRSESNNRYDRSFGREKSPDISMKLAEDPKHWQRCQFLNGLPKPATGCCGVELPRFPVRRNPKCPTVPKWLVTGYRRLRRSTSDTPPTKMILGGIEIEPQHLPWLVRLTIKSLETPQLHGLSECSGTIISSRYVLTAAHCLDHYKELSQLEVFLAEYDTNSYKYDRVHKNKCIENIAMKVEHVIIHEDYNINYLQNDVALLRLSSIIPFTEKIGKCCQNTVDKKYRHCGIHRDQTHRQQFIRPICLPGSDVEDLQDKKFIIGGWGHNSQSHLKRAAFVNYLTNNKCKEKYSYKDDSLLCVFGDQGVDVCHGDSGGPLMVYLNNIYFLSGVVSGKRGDYVCGSKEPSLFNNVFYHKNWIIKHAT